MITPDEIDQYIQYEVDYPSISGSAIYMGTITANTNVTGTAVLTPVLDYPRNVLFSFPGGTTAGTVTVYGRNQFGYPVNETVGFATAAAGGTVAGTRVFATVGSASITVANANTGTVQLGYASGTAAGIAHLFGLPTKIAGTKDLISLNWLSGAGTCIPFGTPQAQAGTAFHSFKGTAVVASTQAYIALIRPAWDNSGQGQNLANLDTTVTS